MGNMLVTGRNILSLPGCEKMKIVAGAGGLDKVINWVHVIEIPNAVDYVKGGELLFMTGVVIGNDVSILLKFVKEINLKKLSGLVINVGPYIKSTPREVIKFADKVNFPIFELPFEVRLVDIIQNICKNIFMKRVQKDSINNFMKEIIFENVDITDEVLNKAILYGYSINRSYCALVVDIDNFNFYLERNNIHDENAILNIKSYIEAIIEDVMHRNKKKYFCVMQSDSFFLMVALEKGEKVFNSKVEDNMKLIGTAIKKGINDKLNLMTASVGIGGIYSSLKESRVEFSKGQRVLQILKCMGKNNCVVVYRDLGVFRLFFEMNDYKEMRDMFNENLLKLKKYDEKNSSDLIKTLYVYLKSDRNIGKAAERLYIHRNTMKYRINRIEEILNCSLKDEETIFNIKLCIKIGMFLKLLKLT
jgi:sugar diacid utilization regulator